MKYFKSLACAVAFLMMAASQASAASITFALNCQFSGAANDGTCTPGGSYGTVTLSDGAANANQIDFIVDVTAGWYPTALYLNIDPNFVVPGGYTWQAGSATVNSVTQSTDNSGSTWLYMDLAVVSGKNYTDPWAGTFGLGTTTKPTTYFDLSPSLFAFITNDPNAASPANGTALVYLAVSQQNCTGTGCTASIQTSVVGSTSVVPEPASLLLLGTGLGALGTHVRRRARRQSRA